MSELRELVERLDNATEQVASVHARLRLSDMDDRIELGSALQALRETKRDLLALLNRSLTDGVPEGAVVLDVGFNYADNKHTPTVLVGFKTDDWDARDRFARALADAARKVKP